MAHPPSPPRAASLWLSGYLWSWRLPWEEWHLRSSHVAVLILVWLSEDGHCWSSDDWVEDHYHQAHCSTYWTIRAPHGTWSMQRSTRLTIFLQLAFNWGREERRAHETLGSSPVSKYPHKQDGGMRMWQSQHSSTQLQVASLDGDLLFILGFKTFLCSQ